MRFVHVGALFVVVVVAGCRPAEVPQKDLLREARIGSERGDAASCFHAGSLSVEEHAPPDRALAFYAQGCAQKHGPSCDGVATMAGRQNALGEGCNAGDLLSCARLAN